MIDRKNSIGVFDSGVGGLTVLKSLKELMPGEDFIYVADHANCPYGIKNFDTIEKYVLKVGKYLLSRNVKAIVIACNTASLFKKTLQEITSVPIISVIEPTSKMAMNESITKNIAVLATEATIKNGCYQRIILENGFKAFCVPCSSFVDFIEEGNLDSPKAYDIVSKKISILKDKNIDTLIYGCTHFSLLDNQVRSVLGNIRYISCGTPTSIYLKEILMKKDLLNDNIDGIIEIYTTGKREKFLKSMKWFDLKTLPLRELKL